MNKLDKQYIELLQTILEHGVDKKDRTGTGTKSIFGYTIRHNMKDGFPLLTTKKMAFKTMVTELLWFLKGDTNIKYLVDNGCNIWNGDAYKRYSAVSSLSGQIKSLTQEEFINQIKTDEEFAKEWGELGPIYGNQWRKWLKYEYVVDSILSSGFREFPIDQIQNLINERPGHPAGYRKATGGVRTYRPCHRGVSRRCGYGGGNPLPPGYPAAPRQCGHPVPAGIQRSCQRKGILR